MTNNKRGRLFIAAGTMLLLAALSLVLYNVWTDKRAEKTAGEVLVRLKEEIPGSQPDEDDPQPPITPDLPDISSEKADPEEDKAVEIDGRWYIGVIEIPSIGLELPVQKGWNYHNLDIGPCRYSGSPANKDMVIAAHNYTSFFKRIDELNSGDEIVFTSVSGTRRVYAVQQTELIDGYDVDSMTEGSDDWDLTLFTCTWSGYSRVTVRAAEIG